MAARGIRESFVNALKEGELKEIFNYVSIESDSIKNSVLDFLSKYLERRKNRDIAKIVEMFRLHAFSGETVENVGKRFSVYSGRRYYCSGCMLQQ